jgi:phosphatidylinositol 3-kinase
MDTYVKSCAGQLGRHHILGIGDRHLDNLLLHPGSFTHFSFILGIDLKTYLPMRITDDMIRWNGGKGSDNYVKFLSLMGLLFLALRRRCGPESRYLWFD